MKILMMMQDTILQTVWQEISLVIIHTQSINETPQQSWNLKRKINQTA